MGFSGGGSGSSSISGSTDVFLSAPSNNQVLTYDSGTLKWKNANGSSVPAGGTTSQVLAKNSSTDGDAGWIDGVPLSDTAPLKVGVASAGTLSEAARADHQHPILQGLGYAVVPGLYSSPLGPVDGTNGGTNATGQVLMAPFPVFQNVSIVGLRINVGTAGSTAAAAIFDTDPTAWLPRTNVAALPAPGVNSTGAKDITPSTPVRLAPGMYWIGFLALGGSFALRRPVDYINTARFFSDSAPDGTLHTIAFNNSGSGYSSMPSSVTGQTPVSVSGSAPWYQFSSES